MIRCATSSKLLPCSLRNALASAAIFTALSLAGCGDTCFSGFFDGGFQINTGSPASTCPLTKAKGAVRVALVRSPSCELCTSSARVEHLYVMLRGVQLHPSAIADRNSPDWVEVAPQLADEPQQMDLIGGSEPEIVAESTTVPVGTYRQVRLEFVPDAPADGGQLLDKSECGTTLRNRIVMGDGRVDPVLWAGDVQELLITGESLEGSALVVLPDTMMALRISLEPQQVFSSSGSERCAARVVLVGRAGATRQSKSPD